MSTLVTLPRLGRAALAVSTLSLAVACGGTEEEHEHGEELITRVTLSFTAGGMTTDFVANDPDGDGGDAPTIDPITLTSSTTYMVALKFENALETPAEDITAEILEENADHQIFFTGDAVDGPATDNPNGIVTHAYGDMDGGGLPVGLSNVFTTKAAGTGKMTVTLRHMPEATSGEAVKVAGLADMVKSGGLSSIGGSNDVSLEFEVTVQ